MNAEEKLAIQDVIDNVRADLKAAPAAIADTASVLGTRAAVSLFYRLPEWLMVPAICASWAAAASVRAIRGRKHLH